MKLSYHAFLTLVTIISFGVVSTAWGSDLPPPLGYPVPTYDNGNKEAESKSSTAAYKETYQTLIKATEEATKLVSSVGAFGPMLVFNTLGSLKSKETSETVSESVAPTDEKGALKKPDLKDQQKTKDAATKALTLEREKSTDMKELAKVRKKIPESKLDFAILGVATSWSITLDAANVAQTQGADAAKQIKDYDNAQPNLRANVTTNNNIQMRLTSNQNRLLSLTATRAALAGFNGLEKSGTMRNVMRSFTGGAAGGGVMDAVTGAF